MRFMSFLDFSEVKFKPIKLQILTPNNSSITKTIFGKITSYFIN